MDPLAYWANQPSTLAGITGGLPHIHELDILDSGTFLKKVEARLDKLSTKRNGPLKIAFNRAADIGAGIGRVTEALLLSIYSHVDLYEPVPHLLEQARVRIQSVAAHRAQFFLQKAQSFTPPLPGRIYDLIWIQWVSTLSTYTPSCTSCRRPCI